MTEEFKWPRVKRVPVVLYARFTTLATSDPSNDTFETTPLDTLGFSNFQITFRRAAMTGTSPSCSCQMEESADLDEWVPLGSAVLDGTSSSAETAQVAAVPARRYLRCKTTLGGTDPAVTLWAVGYGERTVT